jgi:5-methylcytosine-specific restriction endonuclease McrA
VRLVRYERVPGVVLHLSHRNVMVRDRYQCQYCGATPGAEQLNIDHVLPRCRGGRDTWENLVTSCRSCNLRKGRHTPDECNMRLARPPAPPRWSALYQVLLGTGPTCKAWEPFLQAG